MQGRNALLQEDLFLSQPISSLIPEDHPLKRIHAVLDLSWLHEEVKDCYCQQNGRPGIDPEAAMRLMIAACVENITKDRALMRRAQTDIAFRWFAGYRLDEKLPDHSSLTRIRQRLGKQRFQQLFERSVQTCAAKGLVLGKVIHIDASLIRADVSWESLTTEYTEAAFEDNTSAEATNDNPENPPPANEEKSSASRGHAHGAKLAAPPSQRKKRAKKKKKKKRSKTDPEATMSTGQRNYHLEPTFKQHTAVDDHAGVIVDATVTTGETSEGKELQTQLKRVEALTGTKPDAVTADAGYAHPGNYGALERQQVTAVIPAQPLRPRKKGTQRIPACRFRYNERYDHVTCPAGKRMHRGARNGNGHVYRACSSDCLQCLLRHRCITPKGRYRTVVIVDDFPALLRARRKKQRGWNEEYKELYNRHRSQVEGVHGRSKAHHGLGRAARRGLDNVQIQAYITAAVMNLKKLVIRGLDRDQLATLMRRTISILGTLRRRWTIEWICCQSIHMAA